MCLTCVHLYRDALPDTMEVDDACDTSKPCKDCTAAEQLFPDLRKLAAQAQQALAARKAQAESEEGQAGQPAKMHQVGIDLEELHERIAEIAEVETDWRFYMQHLARKKAESLFDAQELHDLKDGEAIIVSDWKMKLLSGGYPRRNPPTLTFTPREAAPLSPCRSHRPLLGLSSLSPYHRWYS
eukprot:COSAG04_NODE_57_length_30587_cov_86.784632_15_plen_183_part_00